MNGADITTTAPLEYNGRNIAFDPASATTRAAAGHGQGIMLSTTSVSAFTPVTLEWDSLTFDIPRSRTKRGQLAPPGDQGDKDVSPSTAEYATGAPQPETPIMNICADSPGLSRVLHKSSGVVKAGEMLAVIGSSGAGKSTLLNLLAGRIKSSKDCVSGGRIYINGDRRDFGIFTKLAAFVEQDDTMFSELTVVEQIRYAALLRLPRDISWERKLFKVDHVIQELGLSNCRDTVIGSALVKGVSGGERKRCSIGMELVTDPSLLLCDEPTTGLDAFSALNVITTLRKQAAKGRTVIATIHQPRSSIFAQFDKLCVLSEGRTVYFGPAADAGAYFSSIGFTAPSNFNIADYVIDAVSIDYRSKRLETNTKKRVLYLAEQHDSAHPCSRNNTDPESAEKLPNEETTGKSEHANIEKGRNQRRDSFQNPWTAEFFILLNRTIVKLARDGMQTRARAIESVLFGVILGVIWLDQGRELDDSIAVSSLAGVLFFLVAYPSLEGAFACIFDFPLLRAVLMRERASSSYRVSSYWFAALVVDIAKAFVLNVIFTTIVYWMVGLRANAGAYFFAVLCVLLLTLTGEALSQTISVFTGDAQVSSALVPLVLVLSFLFAGFFISPNDMPSYLKWARFLSSMYWGYHALAHNEFDFRTEGPVAPFVEKTYNNLSRWGNLGIVVAFCIVFKALYFITLSWKRPRFEKDL